MSEIDIVNPVIKTCISSLVVKIQRMEPRDITSSVLYDECTDIIHNFSLSPNEAFLFGLEVGESLRKALQ